LTCILHAFVLARQRLTICQAGPVNPTGRPWSRARRAPEVRVSARSTGRPLVARRVQYRLPDEVEGGRVMVMFATILIMSLLAVAVCAVAFGAATRGEARSAARPERRLALEPPRFFASPAAVKAAAAPGVPVELLLSQIERHVRLEQAAAEAYLELPTRDSLHTRTPAPRLN
jgi:hypothetical protein